MEAATYLLHSNYSSLWFCPKSTFLNLIKILEKYIRIYKFKNALSIKKIVHEEFNEANLML